MNKVLFLASTLLFPGAASAADVAVKARPISAPVLSWTGFYVGGEIGGVWADQTATTNPSPSPGFGAPAAGGGLAGFGNLPTSHGLNSNNAFGGVFAGYNWQVGTSLVLSLEGHIDWFYRRVGNNQTVFATFPGAPAAAWNMLYTASNDWVASIRGRAGWSAGNSLFYVTGGPAWTNSSYSATATGLATPAAGIDVRGADVATSYSDTKLGYAVGIGAEWMFSPNWTVRAEYVHYGFENSRSNLALVNPPVIAGAFCVPGACNWALNSGRLDLNTAVIAVSYKFGGPVVAKY